MNQRLQAGKILGGREGAMASAMDENLAQESAIACLTHNARVGLLVLVDHKPVASSVHGQHGDVQIAIEGDVSVKIEYRLKVGTNTRGTVQDVQIALQA